MPKRIQPAARQEAPAKREFPRLLRIGISAFLAFNLFAIIAWCVPLESPLLASCRSMVRPYLVFTGLFQKWDMFAPDPSKLNNFVGAVVTYRDGRHALWNFPRMENLGYVDKYFEERYRKYANDCLRLDMYSGLWPDAARYVARQNTHPGSAPAAVDLVRYWSFVPPPDPNGQAPEGSWNQHTFFHYDVTPGDLE
jgi:hypothetical protein